MAQLNNLLVTGDSRFLNPIKGVAETFQGTCSTAQGTAQKDVTITNNVAFNDNNLVPGVNISVKFTNSNTHGTPTLKVGAATAKGIMRYGTTKPGGLPNNSWHAGAVVLFTYDGTYWVMNDNNDGLEQSLTSSNWNLPLLLSYAGNTDTTTSIVNKSYRNNSIYANPSTGGIYCSQINGATIPSTPDFTNTHRPIKVNGTQILGDNTTPLNLAAGTEISLTNSNGTVTIDASTHTTVNDTTLEISRIASASPTMANVINAIYPVGSIYVSTNAINPQTYISGTTWEIFGSGKTIVGVDTSDSSFNTVEKTGGGKEHTHSLNEGSTGDQGHSWAKFTYSTGNKRLMMRETALTSAESFSENSRTTISGTWSGQTTGISSYGAELGGTVDYGSSLQPYITVYMWKRTA